MKERFQIFDSGPGSGADRYTIVDTVPQHGRVMFFGFSAEPFHPQGIGQHGELPEQRAYRNLGKRITLADLPTDDARKACEQFMGEKTTTEDLHGLGDPREKLRALLPEGSTLHCVAKSVSRGNASTVIDFFLLRFEPCSECDGTGVERADDLVGDACPECKGRRGTVILLWLSRMIYNAGIGRWDAKHEALRQGGHGLDRADHIVRSLARVLYGREDALRREWL